MKIFTVFISILFYFSASSQQPFTLQQAIEYGIANSKNLKLAQLEILNAEADIREYKSIGYPKLNGEVGYQYFIDIPTSLVPAEFFGGPAGTFAELQFGTKNSLSAALNFNTLLFDGSFFVGLQAQKLYKELVSKQLDQTESEVRINIKKAYLAALITIENISILDQNITNLQSILNETEIIYSEGFIEKLDVDRLRLSLENLKVQKDNIARLQELSFNVLKFQMGYPLTKSIKLIDEIEGMVDVAKIDQVQVSKEENVTLRPEWSVIETGEALNKLEIKSIKAGYLPNLIGFASHQQNLQRDDLFDSKQAGWLPATLVGLTMNVPIFDGFEKKYKGQKAQISLEKTLLQKEIFLDGFNLSVRNAKLGLINARKNLENIQRIQNLAEEILNTTKIKYKEGVGSSLEISQAESELYDAQGKYINALYDLLVAKTELEIALGTL